MGQSKFTKKELFIEWIAKAKAIMRQTNPKATNAHVAVAMGLAPLSLKKYTAPSSDRKPGQTALQLLGELVGEDWRLLEDDPGMAPAGIAPDEWADADDATKIFTNAVFNEAKGLSAKQKSAILQMIRGSRDFGGK